MYKILVTGANGFVGRAICKDLRDKGHHVIAGARTPPDETYTLAPSLQNDANWSALLADCDIVVHTAGRAHVLKETACNPLEIFRKINTAGTLALARQAADAGVKRFIYISSIGVNGNTCERPFTEDDVPAPHDLYAISKLEAENGLWKLAASTNLEVVIIRPTLIYGAGAVGNFALLTKAVQRGYPLPLGSIQNKRSFLGIDNLADLISHCLIHPAAVNQLYLASDTEVISVSTLINHLAQIMGCPSRMFSVPAPLLLLGARLLGKEHAVKKLTNDLWVDTSKLRKQLGWTPPLTQLAGLKRAVANIGPRD